MPLHVEDREIVELAERLAELKRTDTTDAVRQALTNEIERSQRSDEEALAKLRSIQEKLKQMSGGRGLPITKEWRDSLYEDG